MATVRHFPWKDFGPEFEKWLREKFQRIDLMQSCLSCHHFLEPNETCKKFNSRPPARIIANGCQHYDDDFDIPF